jgi:hypothetical protein
MDDLELSEIAPPRKSNRPSNLTLREPAPLKPREPDRPDDPESSEDARQRARKRSLLAELELDGELTPLQLMRLVDAATSSVLRSQSVRAFRREFGDRAVKLGPRRDGFRLYEVLKLPAPKLPK